MKINFPASIQVFVIFTIVCSVSFLLTHIIISEELKKSFPFKSENMENELANHGAGSGQLQTNSNSQRLSSKKYFGMISGHLISHDKRPLKGVKVLLRPEVKPGKALVKLHEKGDQLEVKETLSDCFGEFCFRNVPQGSYSVLPTGLPSKLKRIDSHKLLVTPNQHVVFQIENVQSNMKTFNFRLPNGKAPAEVRVSIEGFRKHSDFEWTPNNRKSHIKAGIYRLSAKAPKGYLFDQPIVIAPGSSLVNIPLKSTGLIQVDAEIIESIDSHRIYWMLAPAAGPPDLDLMAQNSKSNLFFSGYEISPLCEGEYWIGLGYGEGKVEIAKIVPLAGDFTTVEFDLPAPSENRILSVSIADIQRHEMTRNSAFTLKSEDPSLKLLHTRKLENGDFELLLSRKVAEVIQNQANNNATIGVSFQGRERLFPITDLHLHCAPEPTASLEVRYRANELADEVQIVIASLRSGYIYYPQTVSQDGYFVAQALLPYGDYQVSGLVNDFSQGDGLVSLQNEEQIVQLEESKGFELLITGLPFQDPADNSSVFSGFVGDKLTLIQLSSGLWKRVGYSEQASFDNLPAGKYIISCNAGMMTINLKNNMRANFLPKLEQEVVVLGLNVSKRNTPSKMDVLFVGDKIKSINGLQISEGYSIWEMLQLLPASIYNLKVERHGSLIELKVAREYFVLLFHRSRLLLTPKVGR